ncbi:MAG: CDGSH iron-sulfur domain-containing protein [Deltaproteobacteria bacterium]|nr:CDGSH iron-sulfur domain-containing protein [Deltaproteobacteria bacterium]
MDEPVIAHKGPAVREEEPGYRFWCSCGRSKKQPYCDSSHKGTGFSPVKVHITEKKTVTWCQCKHSKNKPFCDETHKSL